MAIGQRLTWLLCDLNGNQIDALDVRYSGRVELGVKSPRTATVSIPLGHTAARTVQAMRTRLKVFLGSAIILNAPVFLPSYAGRGAGSQGALTISAADNQRLGAKFTRGFAAQVGIDQSEIMARLVEHADATAPEKANGIPGHGIQRGSLPASVNRDRTYYDGSQIWELLRNIGELIGGPDFELEALDRTDGIAMQLNTYPSKQGSDKSSSVVLEFAVGRNNASAFGWEPSGEGLVNRMIQAGETPAASPTTPAWISESVASQQLFGIYEGFSVDTDVSVLATLREKAEAVVARNAFPINYFNVTPAVEQGATAVGWARGPDGLLFQTGEGYGVPPRFAPNGDYWLGDRISTIADLEGQKIEVIGRVMDATLNEVDQAGAVAAEISCEPVVVATALTGAAVNLTLSPEDEVVSDTSVPESPAAAAAPAYSGPYVTVTATPYKPPKKR